MTRSFTLLCRALALVALAFALSGVAQAAAPAVCTVTGAPTAQNPACVVTNGVILGGSEEAPNIYWSARSMPNGATLGDPIDAHTVCRYIDNQTLIPPSNPPLVASPRSAPPKPGGTASVEIFIPFKTPTEWGSFISGNNNPAGVVYAVPCARPTKPDAYIETGATTSPHSENHANEPVRVQVDIFGHPAIAGRGLTAPATTRVLTKSFTHTRRDCNALQECETRGWTETFEITCTATLNPPAPTASITDGAKWVCEVTNHDDPEPPVQPPAPRSCGAHANGETYFVDATGSDATGYRPATVPDECPYSVGTRRQVWNNQIEVTCQNGAQVPTGNKRKVDFRFEGECGPRPEETCLFRANGTTVSRPASACCIVPPTLKVCGATPSSLPSAIGANKSITLSGGYNRKETWTCERVGRESWPGCSTKKDVYSLVGPCGSGRCEAASCGNHAHGSTYWKPGVPPTTTSTQTASAEQCPAGGVVQTVVKNEREYACNNGTESATGNTRQTDPAVTVVCEPLSCGANANGAKFWQTQGSETSSRPATQAECAAGGTVTTVAEKQVEYVCNNGQTQATGQTRLVNPSSQITCNPASCGGQASGARYWVATEPSVTTRPATANECPSGGTATVTTTREAEYLCNNGTQTATGNLRSTGSTTQLSCNPAMCGDHPNGSVYWLPAGTTTSTQPATAQQCPQGGTVTVTSTLEREHKCQNGEQVALNHTRVTGTTQQLTCNQPQACNGNPSGSTFWKPTGSQTSTRPATQAECAHGGTATVTTPKETEYRCQNGQETCTGKTRLRPDLATVSLQCHDAPRSCGDHASGTTYWKTLRTETRTVPATAQQCANGGTVVLTEEVQQETRCNNGQETCTGHTRRVTVNQQLTCNEEPRSCGDHAHGSTFWETVKTTTRTVPATAAQCPHGGSVKITEAAQSESRCENGTTVCTGKTRKVVVNEALQCNDGPRGCGSHGHGHVFWEIFGRFKRSLPATHDECPWGGYVDVEEEERCESRCDNGNVIQGAHERFGVGRVLRCNQPRSCGAHAHGSVFWNFGSLIFKNRQATTSECRWGGNMGVWYRKKTQMRCEDGQTVPTGHNGEDEVSHQSTCKATPTCNEKLADCWRYNGGGVWPGYEVGPINNATQNDP